MKRRKTWEDMDRKECWEWGEEKSSKLEGE